MKNMTSNREGISSFLDNVVQKVVKNEKFIGKIASTNHPAEKKSNSSITLKIADEKLQEPDLNEKTEISLREARVARRTGSFVKVAGRNDLYQEAKTNNYWKITGSKVIRAFDEQNGIVVEE